MDQNKRPVENPLSEEETKKIAGGGPIDRGGPLPAQKIARPGTPQDVSKIDDSQATPPIFVPADDAT